MRREASDIRLFTCQLARKMAPLLFSSMDGQSCRLVGGISCGRWEVSVFMLLPRICGGMAAPVSTRSIVTMLNVRLSRNGFFGPDSYCMNHELNAEYAAESLNDGFIDLPTLFLLAEYDYTCECVHSRLAEPIQLYCRNLTMKNVKSGHWMAQEKPREVNAALTKWLVTVIPDIWPG